jgi:hypothetical protein
MKGQRIPDRNHVARHCRASELSYGQDGQPNGVSETAFQPRATDVGGISAVWLDFFAGTRPYQLNCVRSVISLKATSTQRLAIVSVASIIAAISSAGVASAIIEDPCDDLPPDANVAHALISPLDILNDKTIREAIASSVNEMAAYKLTP